MFHGNAPASSVVGTIDDIFDGPVSATNQISGGMTSSGSVSNSMRGFAFTPQRPLLVTEFGKNEPNGTTRSVRLWDEASQSSMHEEQVPGGAGAYSYNTLAGPVWLDQGTTYVLSIFQGVNESYFFQQNSQTSPDIVHNGMRFCNSCTVGTFPDQNLANYHYGYPDLRYYTKQEVSVAPTVDSTVVCVEDASCDADCSAAICGDNVINTASGEECDDGSVVDGDGCSSDCLVELPGTSTGDPSTGSGGSGSETTDTEDSSDSDDPSDSGITSGSPTSGNPATSGDEASDSGASMSGGSATDATAGTSGSASAGTGGIPAGPLTGGLGETGCSCTTQGDAPALWSMMLVLLAGLRSRRRIASR